jgi:hypothetical protein
MIVLSCAEKSWYLNCKIILELGFAYLEKIKSWLGICRLLQVLKNRPILTADLGGFFGVEKLGKF